MRSVSNAAGQPRERPARPPELSVVLPTRNEDGTVDSLYRQLRSCLDGIDWEAVFVDDSDDRTVGRLAAIAARDRRVRVRHRHGARGLGSAIATGLRLARGRFVCVMDADGQHPPALLPRLLDEARRGADVVVASRFAPGGTMGDVPTVRRRVARCARAAARLLVPAARATSDPLSGCFLLRRALLSGRRLRPGGWKVLLDILATARPRTVVDVPYRFGCRRSGQSKLGARTALEFGLHLARLAAGGRDWRPLSVGLQYALLVRVGLVAVTLLTLAVPHAGQAVAPAGRVDIWQEWAQWDGVWYERIAWAGYAGSRHAYAFFPLYPVLLRAVSALLTRDLALAGVLVSSAASVACFSLLYAQVARDHGPATAERAVRYLALFPTGFYLAAAYTEATFLALALLAVGALRRRSWALAAAAGGAAALTRSVGVALALPAAWQWLRQDASAARRASASGGPASVRWPRRASRPRLGPGLAVLGAPLGLGAYMLFSAWTRADPLAFLHAESLWARHLTWPWTTAAAAVQASLVGGPYAARNALDLAAVVLAAGAVLAGRRCLHPAERLFAWGVLAMTVAAPLPVGYGEVLLSSTRLVLAAYPAFVVLARLGRHPAVDRLVTVVFPLVQAGAFVLFTHGYFVA